MAVTWTPFADGYSLALLRPDINTFNLAVKANIDSIETDVTTIFANLPAVSDGGIIHIVDGVMPATSLTTAYQKVGMVHTTAVDVSNSHVTANNVTYTYTINSTGVYKMTFSGGMTANNGAVVEFNYNINGASAITNPPSFVGAGARVVPLANFAVMQLTAGSVLYIEAKADSAITMTPVNCGLTIEKTYY